MVATHLDAQDIEIRVGGFDRWSFLTIEERNLDQWQIVWVGHEVPCFGRVAGVESIRQVTAYLDSELTDVRVGNRCASIGRVVSHLKRLVELRSDRRERCRNENYRRHRSDGFAIGVDEVVVRDFGLGQSID